MHPTRTILLLVALVIAVTAVSSQAGDFKYLTFFDPYWFVSRFGDTSIYHPASYCAQLDSLGLKYVHSIANAVSTDNSFGIKIIGQDTIKVRKTSTQSSMDIFFALSSAHNIYADPRNNQVGQTGCQWTYGTGGEDSTGWKCDVALNSKGVALVLTGPKVVSDNPSFKLPLAQICSQLSPVMFDLIEKSAVGID